MVTFVGFYNFSGSGTEEVQGNGSKTIPSHSEVINNDPKTFFSGQFSNLSRELIHLNLKGVSGQTQTMHKHDIRPYESINVVNIPLGEVDIIIESLNKLGVHGMGALWQVQDEDEYAVFASKSSITESGSLPNVFNTDSYTRLIQAGITTGTDLVVSGNHQDFALYKVTVTAEEANVIDLFWTDASDGNVKFICRINLAGAGTFTLDTSDAMLRNPNRPDSTSDAGGKLRITTSTAGSTTIDVIGHMVHAGQ
tara:strand:- start:57 stop:812 length:756 start_codon:yes stop_codon:yes gene_type:complete